jgi:hypothetical protein
MLRGHPGFRINKGYSLPYETYTHFKTDNYPEGQVGHNAGCKSNCVGLLCFKNGKFLYVRTHFFVGGGGVGTVHVKYNCIKMLMLKCILLLANPKAQRVFL